MEKIVLSGITKQLEQLLQEHQMNARVEARGLAYGESTLPRGDHNGWGLAIVSDTELRPDQKRMITECFKEFHGVCGCKESDLAFDVRSKSTIRQR